MWDLSFASGLHLALFMVCPYCSVSTSVIASGSFVRKIDGIQLRRFLCKSCEKTFSDATFEACYRQKKRHLNRLIYENICSGVSQRRVALSYRIHRRTVVRKILFLATQAEIWLREHNQALSKAKCVELDEMETVEHTKCKPVSIAVMVESKTRRILAMDVARMPAKGLLAKISRKKYGPRPDERAKVRRDLLKSVTSLISPTAEIKSDEHPGYPSQIREFFPHARHRFFKGRRACVTGQGELKRGGFDPIFSINHTCAMHRANINRLFRRTWCTSKRMDRLKAHLTMYMAYHNLFLLEHPAR